MESLEERLRIRASIRRQIQTRKSVQEGKPDRLSDLLDEAANYISTMNKHLDIKYQFTSTKEYVDAFPCAYRQWRADDKPGNIPGCNKIHGYAFSMKFYFGTNDLDVRNWVVDYGSLSPLKEVLQDQFDHTLLVSSDDPHIDWYKEANKRGIAKVIELPRLGCEGIADMLYKYVNGVFIPDVFGAVDSERIWCYKVSVRETQSNLAFREGHREWGEDLTI